MCAHAFVIDSATHYSCNSRREAGCTNTLRVRRDLVERKVLGAIDAALFDPALQKEMVAEVQREWNRRRKAKTGKAAAEAELEARLRRLKKRRQTGDPDLEPEELDAAIRRVEAQLLELAALPTPKELDKMVALVPKAHDAYRRAVHGTLNPERAAQARMLIREVVGGDIKLVPVPATAAGAPRSAARRA